MLSAFLNDVFYAAASGRSFLLPLAPDDATWVMSLKLVSRNLAHALELPPSDLPQRRYWSLPALHVTMSELVEVLAEGYGSRVSELIGFAPHPESSDGSCFHLSLPRGRKPSASLAIKRRTRLSKMYCRRTPLWRPHRRRPNQPRARHDNDGYD
jgi:hypothetical protein